MGKIDVFSLLNETTLAVVDQTTEAKALEYGDRYLFAYADENGRFEEWVLMDADQLRAACERAPSR